MSLDVSADEVEFLSPRGRDEGGAPAPRQTAAPQDLAGFTDIQVRRHPLLISEQ